MLAEQALAAATSRLVGGTIVCVAHVLVLGPLPLRTLRVLRPGMTRGSCANGVIPDYSHRLP